MDIFHHFDKFTVFLAAMETSNRYSIAKLHSEHENSVVHDQSLTQINPIKDGKILVM